MDDLGEALSYQELLEENRRLRVQNQENKERLAAMMALQELARSLTLELNLDPLLKMTLRSAVEVVNATAGSLLLLDPLTGHLVFEVIEGGGGEALQKRRMRSDEGIAGWVFQNRRAVIVEDVHSDERFYPGIDQVTSFQTSSLLCAPLMIRGEAIGVLQVLNKKSGEVFNNNDLDIMNIFAAQSAVAIENARLYEAVREERDRVLAVEEDVRRRLARDLHDSLSQLVAAALMNVRFLQEEVSKKHPISQNDLLVLESVLNKALYQVRTMLFDLRPVILETQGLVPALENYAQRLRQEGTGKLHLTVDRELGRLAPKIETALFSVVREALNNVRRHARAENVWVKIHRDDDQVILVIEDDGQGFEPAQMETTYAERGSIGLLNMRERAESVGATFSLVSAIGEGTRIELTVPIYGRVQESAP